MHATHMILTKNLKGVIIKKIIQYLQIIFLLILLALPFIGLAISDVQAEGPECNYTKCPGGNQWCCAQGGVTLFNRPPEPK